MKKVLKYIPFVVVIIGLVGFNVYTFVTVSQQPPPEGQPDLDENPVKMYGRIEPVGGEVFVSAPLTRRVVAIHVREGGTVRRGDPICTLEHDLERVELSVAEARLEMQRKNAEISMDEFGRKRQLFETRSITEFEYLQSRLRKELDQQRVVVTEREVEAARTALNRLTLTAPVDGVVYHLDVSLGESLRAGDDTKIMVGERGVRARMYIEAFWIGGLDTDASYAVHDAETDEYLGRGEVQSLSSSLSEKKLRTEDPRERFDTLYREVIMLLEPEAEGLLPGLAVYALLHTAS